MQQISQKNNVSENQLCEAGYDIIYMLLDAGADINKLDEVSIR